MKKVIVILVIVIGGVYYINSNYITKRVSELSTISDRNIVRVKGIVKNNFKLFGEGFFELKDLETNESILVLTNNDIHKVGESITVNLKKGDIITFNDKTYSIYEQIE